MNKFGWLFVLVAFCSCGDKKSPGSGNNPVTADEFLAGFHKLATPYSVADTGLIHTGDTNSISYEVLKQFVPDSAITLPIAKKDAEFTIHPVGKIESKNELYLLLTTRSGKNTTLFTCLFSNDKKKKAFLNHLPLLSSSSNDGYTYRIDINSEPTFIITKEKNVNGEYSFTRNGYAYSSTTKGFIEVVNESNENKQANVIINPIDTMAKTFTWSGDYIKDKTNFISVRDGNMAGRYIFFLHTEKNKGDCTGELKGTLTMIDDARAIFQQRGDPCLIDFRFNKNIVTVKERGSCGNHRGITCLFDDSYKKNSPQTQKGKKKAR